MDTAPEGLNPNGRDTTRSTAAQADVVTPGITRMTPGDSQSYRCRSRLRRRAQSFDRLDFLRAGTQLVLVRLVVVENVTDTGRDTRGRSSVIAQRELAVPHAHRWGLRVVHKPGWEGSRYQAFRSGRSHSRLHLANA